LLDHDWSVQVAFIIGYDTGHHSFGVMTSAMSSAAVTLEARVTIES
jgi:hypothetical protein